MSRALPGSAAYANEYARQVNRSLRLLGATCPHCGNKNHALIETNGVAPHDPDFTLLCVARVWAKERRSRMSRVRSPTRSGS